MEPIPREVRFQLRSILAIFYLALQSYLVERANKKSRLERNSQGRSIRKAQWFVRKNISYIALLFREVTGEPADTGRWFSFHNILSVLLRLIDVARQVDHTRVWKWWSFWLDDWECNELALEMIGQYFTGSDGTDSFVCPASVCQFYWAAMGWKCKHCRRECWYSCDRCQPEWLASGWKCLKCKGVRTRTVCNLCHWKGRKIRITMRDMAGNVQGPLQMSASTTIASLEKKLRRHLQRIANVDVKGIKFLLEAKHTVFFANLWPCIDNLYRQAIPANARCGDCADSSGDLRLLSVRQAYTELKRQEVDWNESERSWTSDIDDV